MLRRWSRMSFLALCLGSAPALADEPVWPSEQQEELVQLQRDHKALIDKRRKARFENDEDEVKSIDKKLKKIDEEIVTLLQAMGQI
jgi:hypothetical protein